MLTLKGTAKPTITQIITTCKQIPFAKSMRKNDVVNMLNQLRENGLVAEKTTNLSLDEDDICFAFEDTPFATFLTNN